MLTPALHAYEQALRDGAALWARPTGGGVATLLDVPRFLAPADADDAGVLDRCTGSVLDVGCGPGRILAACVAMGRTALGIDAAPEAVRRARRQGLRVVHTDVFATVPQAGEWGTALLLDGNIGIGGDPARLLRRVQSLVRPDGRVIVETDADAQTYRRDDLELVDEVGRLRSASFAWARLGRRHLHRVSYTVGLDVVDEWASGGRQFTALSGRAA